MSIPFCTPYQSPQRHPKFAIAGAYLLLVGKDIGITGVKDGHGTAAEELTAGSAKLNLWEGTS